MISDRFPVIEIFGPTIQGEGPEIGGICSFVRFGGCNDRCVWCDTMYAVDPDQVKENAEMLTASEIADRLPAHIPWVVLSGGNPLIHNLPELVEELRSRRRLVAVETQGNFWRPWVRLVDLLVLSPKPPSAKIDFNEAELKAFLLKVERQRFKPARIAIKIPIFDMTEDLLFAERIHTSYPLIPIYLSVGTDVGFDRADELLEKFERLINEVYKYKTLSDAHISPQLHVLLWGNERGR